MQIYAVVGLGYVGLDLATALAKKHKVIGFDIDKTRIADLKRHYDRNNLIDKRKLASKNISYTDNIADIREVNFFIVSVPTPSFMYEMPDLAPLKSASLELAQILKQGDIIVFESTVYPGTTNEVCIPILEENTKLKEGEDFFVGYSPERVNPGDKKHILKNITKIVACANKAALKKIKSCYESICNEVYVVSSIKTAEAVKILENTQRDINIAFMNEFSQIMHTLNINTNEVINGAKTKWSFVPYKPGFVGGHCIAIDPYYLAFQAKQHGVQPDLILTARKINDGMTTFIVQSLLRCLLDLKIDYKNINIGIFGITYKENVSDIRNSLAFKLIKELEEYHFKCHVHDPLFSIENAPCKLESFDAMHNLSVIIIVVAHEFYRKKGINQFIKLLKKDGLIMDIPSLFNKDIQKYPNISYWGL